jgi:hypothetical protein
LAGAEQDNNLCQIDDLSFPKRTNPACGTSSVPNESCIAASERISRKIAGILPGQVLLVPTSGDPNAEFPDTQEFVGVVLCRRTGI